MDSGQYNTEVNRKGFDGQACIIHSAKNMKAFKTPGALDAFMPSKG